jgi:CRISPR/Cas system CMR subunit Cmr6 (Cas7 group RAMP superfamily)
MGESYQQRRAQTIDRKDDFGKQQGPTQEQKEAYWEAQGKERQRCHQNVFAWVIQQKEDKPETFVEFNKMFDERYKAVNWAGMGKMQKLQKVFLYANLYGCPYLVGSWTKDNWEKGNQWMMDNFNQRPKVYYENGYRKYRVSREEVYTIFPQQ